MRVVIMLNSTMGSRASCVIVVDFISVLDDGCGPHEGSQLAQV